MGVLRWPKVGVNRLEAACTRAVENAHSYTSLNSILLDRQRRTRHGRARDHCPNIRGADYFH